MELYLFRPAEYEKLYNCSVYNIEDVPLANRTHTVLGASIIVLFIIFEILYIPCLFVIAKHLKQSCYKFMLAIGITDVIVMWIVGLQSGYFAMTGAVFCSYPNLIYITGTIATVSFISEPKHIEESVPESFFVICFTNATGAGIYVYMQFVRISDVIIIIAHYEWLLAHGIPSVIYLLMNRTIRNDCLRMVKKTLNMAQTSTTSKISPASHANTSQSATANGDRGNPEIVGDENEEIDEGF
ncbi:serpentine type 7TM GPCR chemoreceptor srt domain-containing protein [Ditylenchus destructor]|nr:serpentine type 7TM GPCR chemoreceptor srt domain-containing protein [Ditylenchus destructor]